ncbi:transcriptional regulator, TetR family [Actinopolyspora xinjiangensis]|uniref:Transcriptional regulator, TetR family n=1 Tax=Actinopolyspora xinjiangensis TaxID=405564 RepID=A0A1H0NUM4_9ACTN|nr:TetR/AcrR family transcriptional regulator [Actinopolyspora xinjiangensis]SDO96155.1 transcriptional regulator, TetR family [Actinopolyspora xinjiangensis]
MVETKPSGPGTGEPGSARQRILDTASRLFYESGIQAVGVNTLAARAGVTKVTLYAHFGSKDGLVAAHLAERDRRWRETLERASAGRETTEQRLAAVFESYEEWTVADGFRGCGFVNAGVELTAADHPGREVIERNKEGTRTWLAEIAEAAGCSDPSDVAEEWFLLLEGAVVRATLRRDATPLHRAHRAALRLLREETGG